ncbi:MAG: LacI family DNA-binding transcriptional regulator [Pseudomonadota bacterium]
MKKPRWKSQRVTIKDIARLANVDPSTVTRALQGSERVKKSTRQSIEKIAAEVGYVPSVAARTLVMKRSQLVGVVIPDMTNPFFAELARGIEDEAAKNNLRILIRNTEGQQLAEKDAIKLFMELDVDGLLVPMARCPKEFYERLEESCPVIHVNRLDAKYHVSCDSLRGARMVMDHLIDHGHRRIAFVNGPSGPVKEPKMAAYKAALNDNGIHFEENLIFEFDGALQSTKEIGNQLLSLKTRPTAVFAWNDICAIGLIHALNEQGLSVPGDISVAGHDDILLAGSVLPPLTTVHWPMYELGQESVRYLLGLRAGYEPRAPEMHKPSLVVRASTGPVPS